jgi:integrase
MKLAERLTAKVIAKLELPPGKDEELFWDAKLEGYGYRMRRSGACAYVVQYRHGGRSQRISLLAAKFNPDQARTEAERLLHLAGLGQDPAGEKKRKQAADRHTFSALATVYLDAKKPPIVRPRTFIEWKRYLQESYFKPLHSLPVDGILRKDVAACVLAIARKNGQVAAARARSALSALFTWAMESGLAENNPTIGTAKPKAPPERTRVLTDAELLAVWQATGEPTEFNRIVRLLLLTGQRRTEVGGVAWPELDLDGATWIIPAERAKNGREHKVPLGSLALDIIRSVPEVAGRDLLFGARSSRGFLGWAEFKKQLDRRLGDQVRPWTLHDLRRTVATRLGDLGTEPHVIEMLLNHQSGHKRGVAGVYNKSKYERAVRNAVAMWNNHIIGLIEGRDERKVVPLRAALVGDNL